MTNDFAFMTTDRATDSNPHPELSDLSITATRIAHDLGIPVGQAVMGEAARHVSRLYGRQLGVAVHSRLEAERNPRAPLDAGTLGEILARPREPQARVSGLIPWEASTLIVAQRKTGKTTFVLNLARDLIYGNDFLGRFPVRALRGRVALLNFEVSAAQLARWADEHDVPHDHLYLVNLRGRRNPLSDPSDRQILADQLRGRGCLAVIVDPFGRAYTGKSQNDAGEVGAWLQDLDHFAREQVGALDLILTAHAGWNGERTRGASALEDWADSIITLVRDDDDDERRYIRAIGRDVELEEDRLDYDAPTRRLTLAGTGSRKAVRGARKSSSIKAAVLEIVGGRPGINGTQVEAALREQGTSIQAGDGRRGLRELIEQGQLSVESGARGARRYTIAASRLPTSPDLASVQVQT